jgi:hypothetical protein
MPTKLEGMEVSSIVNLISETIVVISHRRLIATCGETQSREKTREQRSRGGHNVICDEAAR